jgi:hypothetical protein
MDFILYGVLNVLIALLICKGKHFIELANKSEWWILIHALLIIASNFGVARGPVGILEFTLTCVFPGSTDASDWRCVDQYPILTPHM